jgi:predicted lipoprotein with Yx(FWY)xxD motif
MVGSHTTEITMKNKNFKTAKYIISILSIMVIILSGIIIGVKYYAPNGLAMMPAIPTIQAPPTSIYQVLAIDPKGSIITDVQGRALYTYAPDMENESVCIHACTQEWIPYHAEQLPNVLPANFTLITRDDRTRQYAYKGKPLYYYVQDTEVGSTIGDGINGFWSLARP